MINTTDLLTNLFQSNTYVVIQFDSPGTATWISGDEDGKDKLCLVEKGDLAVVDGLIIKNNSVEYLMYDCSKPLLLEGAEFSIHSVWGNWSALKDSLNINFNVCPYIG